MNEDFVPGCNLILGKNGCGKSNFLQGIELNLIFLAIIFVLSDWLKNKSK
jgi:AAA15 family ATPase/GTPase